MSDCIGREHVECDCPCHLGGRAWRGKPNEPCQSQCQYCVIKPTTFALAIPHTPWIPERVASLERLRSQLVNRPVFYREFTDREPNWSWSGKLWQWAWETGASHLVQLQDDVQVEPQFWTRLRTLVDAVPKDIIGLESVLAIGSPWYTTGDGLIGVGYVIPRGKLGELLHWRANELRYGSVKKLNEDQLVGLFAFLHGYRIWHPVPTIIDHDVEIASTYGNEHHSHRRPVKTTVRGDAWPTNWTPSEVPHVRRFYAATTAIARAHVKGYSYERYLEDSK